MSDAADDVWTISRILQWAQTDLRGRGSETPRLDAEVLLGFVLQTTRIGLVVDATRPLKKEELAAYKELHRRRRTGEPVAYLVGTREFFGRPFKVDKRVLVPRPDTETLVDVALDRTKHLSLSARALDLCTGSGCVAISFAKERPTSHVLATDLSPGALTVAAENAHRLGAVPWLSFRRSDLFEKVTGTFDLITANPPYIPEPEIAGLSPTIRDFEPRMALVGGKDGLWFSAKIIREAPRFLAKGGVLAMEIGAGQAGDIAAIFSEAGFVDVDRRRDYGGIERIVSGALR